MHGEIWNQPPKKNIHRPLKKELGVEKCEDKKGLCGLIENDIK